MSLSDCVKCWDTPCTCGYNHLFTDTGILRKRIELLDDVLFFRHDFPQGDMTDEEYYSMYIEITSRDE